MYNPSSKTPISYYGGKQTMLSYILPMVPPVEQRKVYTETFFGGGALFFAISQKSKNETINDKWDIAINFYEQIRLNFHELNKLIQASLVSRTHHKRAQLILKRHQNGITCDKVKLAWAFWMAANFSFSNKVLYGGVKYSNDQNSVVPEQMKQKKKRFTEWLVSRLEDCYIECNDAVTVLESRNVKEAFHYIDPPYAGADQGHYKGYTWEDYEKLLQQIERLKGRFLLSNYNSEMLQHYIDKNGWHKQEFVKPITAAKTSLREGTKTTNKVEVLVSNYSKTCLMSNKLF